MHFLPLLFLSLSLVHARQSLSRQSLPFPPCAEPAQCKSPTQCQSLFPSAFPTLFTLCLPQTIPSCSSDPDCPGAQVCIFTPLSPPICAPRSVKLLINTIFSPSVAVSSVDDSPLKMCYSHNSNNGQGATFEKCQNNDDCSVDSACIGLSHRRVHCCTDDTKDCFCVPQQFEACENDDDCENEQVCDRLLRSNHFCMAKDITDLKQVIMKTVTPVLSLLQSPSLST